jgi:hypothetical protein
MLVEKDTQGAWTKKLSFVHAKGVSAQAKKKHTKLNDHENESHVHLHYTESSYLSLISGYFC